jgi:hypothetical protein
MPAKMATPTEPDTLRFLHRHAIDRIVTGFDRGSIPRGPSPAPEGGAVAPATSVIGSSGLV